MLLSQSQNGGPFPRIPGRLWQDWEATQIINEIAYLVGSDASTPQHHQKGICHLQGPVRRNTSGFAPEYPVQEALGPWRCLVFKTPRERG